MDIINDIRSKGGTDDLDNLMTLCGRCHMLVSPVPDWLLTKVWQIPPPDIPIERQKIHAAIDRLRATRSLANNLVG